MFRQAAIVMVHTSLSASAVFVAPTGLWPAAIVVVHTGLRPAVLFVVHTGLWPAAAVGLVHV